MKITLINDKTHDFDLDVKFTSEELRDFPGCVYDLSCGCARMIMEVLDKCDSKEQAEEVAAIMIDQISGVVNKYIAAERFAQKKSILDVPFGDMFESVYREWMDEFCESSCICDEEEFLEICSKNKEPRFKFEVSEDAVNTFILLNDGTRFPIRNVPIELLHENENRFNAYCVACQCIAMVVFDKIYGEDCNPLRETDLSACVDAIKKEIQNKIA